MLPLVFSKGIGSEFNQATAGPVVGGQILSLLLTLLATPIFYTLFDDVSEKWNALWGRIFGKRTAEDLGADEVMPREEDPELMAAARRAANAPSAQGVS
jgi:hypothetical protein